MKPQKLAGNTVVPKWQWTREFATYYAGWLRSQRVYKMKSPLSYKCETPQARMERLYDAFKRGHNSAAVSCG